MHKEVPDFQSTIFLVQKPGFCPDVSKATFGACVIACDEDLHCKDFQKCCSTGCGMLCSNAGLF